MGQNISVLISPAPDVVTEHQRADSKHSFCMQKWLSPILVISAQDYICSEKNRWEKGEGSCVKPPFSFSPSCQKLDLHSRSYIKQNLSYLFTVLCTAVYKSSMDSCHHEIREIQSSVHPWCNPNPKQWSHAGDKFCPKSSWFRQANFQLLMVARNCWTLCLWTGYYILKGATIKR